MNVTKLLLYQNQVVRWDTHGEFDFGLLGFDGH